MPSDTRQPLLSEMSRRAKLRLLLKHAPPRATVLEVGPGSSWFARQLRQRGFRVTTIDLAGDADIVGDVNDWERLGIRPHSFDVVIALEVIEHVDCLGALRTICNHGGLILLSSPHPRFDWVMQLLEAAHLTQKRTSPHVNLIDFATIDLPAIVRRRPLRIHQVALFRNTRSPTG